MTNHRHPEPPSSEPPTPKQLRYLRVLANRTGRSFAYPKTKDAAGCEIDRLLGHAPSTPGERRYEMDARPAAYGTTVREDETTGYGSTARWA